jgi:ADP-ribosylglycohydrolase
MAIARDYEQRVYAGVLGKIIGVYLGRPFEGWTHERILAELGEIRSYVHERRGLPLVVTDDDISGTFTFLRALEDHGLDPTPAQIGETWLNYLVENRTVLWWGGMGNSTEHTAYLRLKHGVAAPRSGSAALNGRVVSEQIGAQIFIDGWAMVAPGDPERAADLARRAASVSHDGEAVHAAQAIAAMEALAFVEPALERLVEAGLRVIPRDCLIARLIEDIRNWRAGDGDWRRTRARIAERYGYDAYGGNCHVVPNHALVQLALLYGGGDFGASLMIVNTSGWDTDCNSGNVGCLLGIRGGLAAIDAGPDWRGPVADRMYLPSADGGRAITDALSTAYRVASLGRALAAEAPLRPRGGARFHFSQPGSVQGFRAEGGTIANPDGQGLVVRGGCATTPTFIPAEALGPGGYGLMASPTLYPGQTVRAALVGLTPAAVRLLVRHHGPDDRLVTLCGPEAAQEVAWVVPDTAGALIAEVGLEVRGDGAVRLERLTWDGVPAATFGPSARRGWVAAVDQLHDAPAPFAYRLIQNEGTGLAIQGAREWTDYRLEAAVAPHLAAAAGIAARVQGLRRYYALLLAAGAKVRLVKALDGARTVLAEADLAWEYDAACTLAVTVAGSRLRADVGGRALFDVTDSDQPLTNGAVAMICAEGRIDVGPVAVRPVAPP